MPDDPRSKSKELTPAAKRALAEADARRKAKYGDTEDKDDETGGPRGHEPTRYGDWERKGIAYDF
ncbi:MAG: DUF1674 domain-containing protein [Pseudomonadota bacterium]